MRHDIQLYSLTIIFCCVSTLFVIESLYHFLNGLYNKFIICLHALYITLTINVSFEVCVITRGNVLHEFLYESEPR
jgi:hypothetical protein